MIRQQARVYGTVVLLCDLITLTAAFLLSYWIRSLPSLAELGTGELFPLPAYAWLLALLLLIWGLLLLANTRPFRAAPPRPFRREVRLLLQVGVSGVILSAAILFALRQQEVVSRALLGLFSVTGLGLQIGERYLLRRLHRAVLGAAGGRRVLVIGSDRRAMDFAAALEAHRSWGFEFLGFIDEGNPAPDVPRARILGSAKEVPKLLRRLSVDELIFVVGRRKLEELEDLFLLCEEEGVRTHLAADFFPRSHAKVLLDDLNGVPLITFTTVPQGMVALFIKRAFDLVAATTMLALLAVPMAAIALAVKLTSRGPLLFHQTRCGISGRLFTMYKFRSMVHGAQELRSSLAHLNEADGPVFKIRRDPRRTRVGAFLRRYNLDELPQLWNVLRGEMSLVGPRPPIPEEVEQYERWQRRRLSMKPGLTCLWQVSGRHELGFKEWMRLDLEYIDRWSLWLDFKILLRTIPVVLLGQGE
ncbi:MAG TPA: sugar transferase [Acidobacteriota bacterium]